MIRHPFRRLLLAILVVLLVGCSGPTSGRSETTAEVLTPVRHPGYTDLDEAAPGGIGKLYLGREIANVMSHKGSTWLDRPGRTHEERTDLLLSHLPVSPTDTVADIGAGTGFMSFRLAPMVPEGRVLAVEIQPEFIQILDERRISKGALNVEPILGTIEDPHLPSRVVDLVLIVDSYHEFSHPWEMMTAIRRSLAPGGVVVIVEFRLEDPAVRIKKLHKMTAAQLIKEMEAAGFVLAQSIDELPMQHMMVFESRAGS